MHKNEIWNDQITYNDHILYDVITQSNPHLKLPTPQVPNILNLEYHKQHQFQNQLRMPNIG